MTYLTNQCLYVGSHLGDSQLIQISPTTTTTEVPSILSIPPDVRAVSAATLHNITTQKGKEKASSQNDMEVDDDDDSGNNTKGRVIEPQGSYINILETYKNIAPIMDAICVDIDGSGQAGLNPQ